MSLEPVGATSAAPEIQPAIVLAPPTSTVGEPLVIDSPLPTLLRKIGDWLARYFLRFGLGDQIDGRGVRQSQYDDFAVFDSLRDRSAPGMGAHLCCDIAACVWLARSENNFVVRFGEKGADGLAHFASAHDCNIHVRDLLGFRCEQRREGVRHYRKIKRG